MSRYNRNMDGMSRRVSAHDDPSSNVIRVNASSPYEFVGLDRAKDRAKIGGKAWLDVRVVKDFDPSVELLPEKIVQVMVGVRFMNDKPENVIREYVGGGAKIGNWVARTGIGKTTRFPTLLRRISGASRIMVIEPNFDIAKNVCRYLKQMGNEEAKLWTFQDFMSDEDGVVYSDASTVASAIVNDSSWLESFGYIILDEAHESTGVMYALRVYLGSMKGAVGIIFMSATLDGEDDQMLDGANRVGMVKLRPVTCESFVSSATVEDFWHYRTIRSRVLVLVDTDERCESIVEWYRKHGVNAMAYGWGIDSEAYARIFDQLTKDVGRTVVVVSTCAARTGVTLPIDSVVDLRSTQDYNYDYNNRMLSVIIRPLTIEEAKQGAGRVGRTHDGTAYVVPQEFLRFPYNVRKSQRIYACLWLICLGYQPSEDVFPNERLFLGDMTRLGAAQLLNTYLHPVQARYYMDDEGLYYSNFSLAVNRYQVPLTKARFNNKVLDVDKSDWVSYKVSLSCLNNGMVVTLRLPNDPAGVNNAELLDCAILELKWRNNRGPLDYTTDKNPRLEPKRYDTPDVVDEMKQVEEVRALKPSEKPVKRESKVVARRYSEVQVAAPAVRAPSPVIVEVPSRKNSLPPIERMRMYVRGPDTNDIDSYNSMASQFAGARAFVFIQPIIPYDKNRDFLLCTPSDEILVKSLLIGDILLSGMDGGSRLRYHDAYCAVWNRTRARERFAIDTVSVSKRGPRYLTAFRRNREEEAVNATFELDSLFTLDEQFRMYGMFVQEATRYLTQHGDGVVTAVYPIFVVLVGGVVRGRGVGIGRYFVTLDHVGCNVPIRCVSDAHSMRLEIRRNFGSLSCYEIFGSRFDTPHRAYVDGELVYVMVMKRTSVVRLGPFVSNYYGDGQFLFKGEAMLPGMSGSPIIGVDGCVVGLYVGTVDMSVGVTLFQILNGVLSL